MYFEAEQFIQSTIEYTGFTKLAEDMSTRLEESTNVSIYKIVYQNIHFVISGLVFICAKLIIIWWIRKGRRKVTVRKQNESDATGQQQNQREEMSESEYAEIYDNYYHSVDWRVYPSSIVIYPHRNRSDHGLASARSDNDLEDPIHVYLDVLDDAKSLKDVHTAIIDDNTNGESSNSNTSGTHSSSFILSIMRNSLNDTQNLSHAFEDVIVPEPNIDNSADNIILPDNSSEFSISYLNSEADLSSEEDECEVNLFAENKELYENGMAENIRKNLIYDQLNKVQTQNHLYDQ